jgi:hypothetical protein
MTNLMACGIAGHTRVAQQSTLPYSLCASTTRHDHADSDVASLSTFGVNFQLLRSRGQHQRHCLQNRILLFIWKTTPFGNVTTTLCSQAIQRIQSSKYKQYSQVNTSHMIWSCEFANQPARD